MNLKHKYFINDYSQIYPTRQISFTVSLQLHVIYKISIVCSIVKIIVTSSRPFTLQKPPHVTGIRHSSPR